MERSVFISYSRRDQALAVPLVDLLREAGFSPWLDQRSIPASVPWLAEINHAMRASILVVYLVSPAWSASSSCHQEVAIATELDKPVLSIKADSDAASWVGQIADAYARAEASDAGRARLLGDSSRWLAAGRPAGHLPRGRDLRHLRTARARVKGDAVAEQFLRAANRAARRRAAFGVVGATMTASLWLGYRAADRLGPEVDQRYAADLANLSAAGSVRASLKQNPYAGVASAVAAATAGRTLDATRAALTQALDTNLPTHVDNPHRARPRSATGLLPGVTVTGAGWSARYEAGGIVRVTSPQRVTTLLAASGYVTAMTWDAGRLAMADDAGVSVIDGDTGVKLDTLRGLDGEIDGLRFTSSETVQATSGPITATWHLPQMTTLATTGSWYMAMAGNHDGSLALAVGREGSFTVVNGTAVTGPTRIVGATTSYSVAWVSGHWFVGSEDSRGRGFLTSVSAAGAVGTRIELGKCRPTNLASGGAATVLVVCATEFGYRSVDVTTGTVTRVEVQVQPASLGRWTDGSDLFGTYYGDFHQVNGGIDKLVGAWGGQCQNGNQVLVVAPNGSAVFVGGQSARSGCAGLRNRPKDLSVNHSIIPDYPDMTNIRTAAWTPDSKALVAGFASGQIWFFDVTNFYTRQIVVPTGSEIRGVVVGDQRVLAATRAGQVISVPTDLALLGIDQRVLLLKQRLQIGRDAGLTP